MEERDIFLEAAEIDDPAAQIAFLEQACTGNTALLDRLRNLLKLHNKAGNFLKTPAIDQINLESSEIPANIESADRERELSGKPEDTQNQNSDSDDSLCEVLHRILQPSTRPDSIGRLGEYEILQILGRGAFGIVLKAFDEKLMRMVAIKLISPDLIATSSVRKRFLREARAFAAVRDQNAVHIYAIEELPIPYLVMEYVPGQTIQQRIDERGPMTVLEVLQIGQQVASGLAAAHAVGLIHRDIKPANILLEDGGADRVKITDFGLARALDGDNLTQTEVIAGTPMYMSPEQALGEPFDQRADLFSLGSVMYVMLSGRPPFRSTTTIGLLKRVAEETPPSIKQIVPTAPEWLCKIIDRLHAKKPDDRFSSAKEVADLLNRCRIDFERGDVPILPGFEPQMIPASSWLQRRWWLAAVGVLLVIVAAMFSMKGGGVPKPVESSDSKNEPLPVDQAKLVTSIELGSGIKPKDIGDGSFSDVSFNNGVLKLDSLSHSHHLWINFREAKAEEMTIETQIRIVNPTRVCFAKLVFMPDQGKQIAAIIVFGPTGYEVGIESFSEMIPDADKIPFPGASSSEWIDMKFVISGEKYSLWVNGQHAMETQRESRCPGYVAIACGEALCELKDLRVRPNKVSQ